MRTISCEHDTSVTVQAGQCAVCEDVRLRARNAELEAAGDKMAEELRRSRPGRGARRALRWTK